jgi:uridine kinase
VFKKAYLIGVAGPSCSGKSAIARRLGVALGASILSLDSYYRDLSHLPMDERARVNFDDPAAMNHDLLVSQIRQLASGISIDKPIYDFAHHTPGREVDHIVATEFLIVEGLFTLHWPAVREMLDTSVFISASHDVCLERRMARDIRERGRTVESVTEQYRDTVRPMCDRYILPSEKHADLVLTGMNLLEQSAQCIIAWVGMKRQLRAEEMAIAGA